MQALGHYSAGFYSQCFSFPSWPQLLHTQCAYSPGKHTQLVPAPRKFWLHLPCVEIRENAKCSCLFPSRPQTGAWFGVKKNPRLGILLFSLSLQIWFLPWKAPVLNLAPRRRAWIAWIGCQKAESSSVGFWQRMAMLFRDMAHFVFEGAMQATACWCVYMCSIESFMLIHRLVCFDKFLPEFCQFQVDGVSIGLMIMLLSLTLGFAESTAAEVEILQSAATRSCPETRELVETADACTALTHFFYPLR